MLSDGKRVLKTQAPAEEQKTEAPKKPDAVDARTGKALTPKEIAEGGYVRINRKQRKMMEARARRANKHARPAVQNEEVKPNEDA